MLKYEILELFKNIIAEWKDAEEVIINDRGCVDDYDELDEREKYYLIKINKLLEKIKD